MGTYYIMGDFNVTLIKTGTHGPKSDYLGGFMEKSFYPLISLGRTRYGRRGVYPWIVRPDGSGTVECRSCLPSWQNPESINSGNQLSI